MGEMEPLGKLGQVLEIENFLSVRKCQIEFGDITAIIGPQAAGKSVVAKLQFFGREYFEERISAVLSSEFDKRKFSSTQKARFLELFGNLQGFDSEFQITFSIGEYSIFIARNDSGKQIKISNCAELDRLANSVKRDFAKYISKYVNSDEHRNFSNNEYDYRRSDSKRRDFHNSLPTTLFVPASRSFYSTISSEIFTFLAADERVSRITAQFGRFFEFAKQRVVGEFFISGSKEKSKFLEETNRKLNPVICGDFMREKSKDYIRTSWGRVSLSASSSGQQEALPLMLALAMYPHASKVNDALILEEPEAHLFPEAQKYVLDEIVSCSQESTCDITFTTHSPYVLTCLNTHIERANNSRKEQEASLDVKAYLLKDGYSYSIIDPEDGLIDLNPLDAVSETIAREFLDA